MASSEKPFRVEALEDLDDPRFVEALSPEMRALYPGLKPLVRATLAADGLPERRSAPLPGAEPPSEDR